MAKLHIPKHALPTLRNTDFFSFKKQFTEELIRYFGELIKELKAEPLMVEFPFPTGTDVAVGKITKGENYRGLPYVIADYPRLFTPESVMAYRILFWWGHYFSCTWHLSGPALETFYPVLKKKWPLELPTEALLAIAGDEWQHALEAPVYQPVEKVVLPGDTPAFFKIALSLPLEGANQLSKTGKEFAIQVLRQLKD